MREAVEGIFSGLVTPERVQEVEATDGPLRPGAVGRTGRGRPVGSLGPPTSVRRRRLRHGRAGLVLEGQGRVVAPVPLWATVVLGRHARWPSSGPTTLKCRHAARGGRPAPPVLTAALADVAGDIGRGGPGRALGDRPSPDGDGVVLSGTAFAVPYAHVADRVLVPVSLDDGVVGRRGGPRAPGVTVERAVTTNREIHPHLHLDGVTRCRGRPAGRRGPDPGPGRAGLDPQPGLDRPVRPPGRGDRGRGRPDRRLPQHPGAVRPPAVDLPGDHAPGRRRGHRHRVHPGHHVAGGLAPGPRPGRRPGRQRGLVVRLGGGAAGGASPPSTSTVGWAPTSTTRSTATSCGGSRSSSCSGPPSAQLARLGPPAGRASCRPGRQVPA